MISQFDITAEIDRMVREQCAAKALLDAGCHDPRGTQLWHDDALAEECCIRLEQLERA